MSIRVAIIGVGNCANSFVQGLEYYRGVNETQPVLGLVRPRIDGYAISDIKVVTAFDVCEDKVDRPLHEAIWAFPNSTYRFAIVPQSPPIFVRRGPTLDGRGKYLTENKWGRESSCPEMTLEEVTKQLRDAEVDVILNYLPVGSQLATEFYATAALRAGCAFVNCIPVFLASESIWERRFANAGLPIIGDDVKSQVGATIVHRVLARLFHERGVKLDRTLQLNIGGNGDFLNMLERERLASKKLSKTNAVVSIAGAELEEGNVHIGPSDYVSWLGDRKWAYIKLEGRGFGGAPLSVELKLEVWDSPNSAGIVIDAVRCAKVALDRKLRGAVHAPSAVFMKSPPIQRPDDDALDALEAWISPGNTDE